MTSIFAYLAALLSCFAVSPFFDLSSKKSCYLILALFLLTLYFYLPITPPALAMIAFLPAPIYFFNSNRAYIRWLSSAYLIVVPLVFAIYPGFIQLVLIDNGHLLPEGRDLFFSLSIAKCLLIIALLSLIYNKSVLNIDRLSLIVAVMLSSGWVLLAVVLGVDVDLQVGDKLWMFVIVNLTVTVLAEELYFRCVLQEHMIQWFAKFKYSRYLSAFVAGLIFYFAHEFLLPESTLSWLYLVLSLSYALFYAHYRNILSSILLHFLVNLFSITLLAYRF
jgi:CAAX protease family protein